MKFSASYAGSFAVPIAEAGGILVTRSEPGATTLADALREAGYTAQRCPVIDVVPVDAPALQHTVETLDRFEIAIFASGHAARFGLDRIDAVWPDRPRLTWIAVGAATAAVLAQRGIAALTPVLESSEGVLALPQLNRIAGRRVLICAGHGGRSLLSDELRRRGAQVERAELYRREPVPLARAARCIASGGSIAAVVIASVDGARAFATVWHNVGGDHAVVVIAPSARVAKELKRLKFECVTVARGASPPAVIAALGQVRPTAHGEQDER